MNNVHPNFSTQRQIMRQNLTLVPTNKEGVMAGEAPPPGFDPGKANLSDLMKYGIPSRPDPARFPEGARSGTGGSRGRIKIIVPT
jgi:hypothetical protein